MSPLSLNEIRLRASNFVANWKDKAQTAREEAPNSSLADLYDPITMPPVLLKAHQKLDKVVEKSYGKTFDTDSELIAHLFYLYQNITEGLFVKKPKRKPFEKRKAKSFHRDSDRSESIINGF
jgi:hypothetical protein